MLVFLNELFKLFITLILVSFITFFLLYNSPGSAAENIILSYDMIPTAETIEEIKRQYGLDRPFLVQYFTWLIDAFHGDFGYAYSIDKHVVEEFKERLYFTLMLSGFSIVFIVVFSFFFGILSALNKGKCIDYIISIFSSVFISIPSFWLGLMLIIVFVVHLGWFEITKMNEAKNIILAAISLSLPLIGRYTKIIHVATVEQLSSDYVIGAKTRGISKFNIIINHILPNTIIITLPLIGISIGSILGGTIIIENIFSIPGLGNMVLNAIYNRDYPLIKAFVIFMTLIYIFISFAIDQICKIIDPRLENK